MDLKALTDGMPKKLFLDKKYHSQINIKLMSIHEAKVISMQK